MRWCIRCSKEIGEGFEFCPHCGSSQKRTQPRRQEKPGTSNTPKYLLLGGIILAIVAAILAAIFMDSSSVSSNSNQNKSDSVQTNSPSISVTAREIIRDFANNEIRAAEKYKGKRVVIAGCAASIDNNFGILSISINACGGDFDLDYVLAMFPSNERSQLASLNKHQKIAVSCRISDGGNLLGVQAEDCKIVRK